jgi:AraC-like DNA-binding protein
MQNAQNGDGSIRPTTWGALIMPQQDANQSADADLQPSVLAGRVQSGDPAEDNLVFDLLFDYETVPLTRANFSRDVTFAGTLSAAVYREEVGTSSHNLGTMRGDKIAICIPLVDTSSSWWGQRLKPGQLPISRSGQSIHFTYHDGHENLVVAVDRALYEGSRIGWLSDSCLPEAVTHEPLGQQFLRCPPERVARWSNRLQNLLQAATKPLNTMSAASLENELVTAMRSLIGGGDVAAPHTSTAKVLVEAALEQLDTNGGQPSVADLCAALHVGRRTLEVAFRQVVGASPRQFLIQRQLSRSYALLKAGTPDSTRVTDVAVACGFFELGRFSGRYRQAFGETPRHTLCRRVARTHPKVLAHSGESPRALR